MKPILLITICAAVALMGCASDQGGAESESVPVYGTGSSSSSGMGGVGDQPATTRGESASPNEINPPTVPPQDKETTTPAEEMTRPEPGADFPEPAEPETEPPTEEPDMTPVEPGMDEPDVEPIEPDPEQPGDVDEAPDVPESEPVEPPQPAPEEDTAPAP